VVPKANGRTSASSATGSACEATDEMTDPTPATPSSTTEPTSTAAEPAGTATEPAGTAAEPAGTAAGADTPEATAADADPWVTFAGRPEQPPGRVRRVLRATGRALVHEYSLAVLGGVLLAVLMTWPTLRYPAYTIPQDIYDPTLQAWQMAWSGHALLHHPLSLWQSNTFYPEKYSFAFSDSLLGYAPAGMIGTGPVAALLRYNIMFVLAHALMFVGMYALARQLGSGRTGAAVAAVAFAYAPWRLAQEGHLHVQSAGAIPLALAMLAHGHGWSLRYGYRPDRRHAGWALAGWLVAAWQISLGFGIGLPFAYALAVIVLVAVAAYVPAAVSRRRPRPRFGVKLLIVDAVGGLFFAAVGAALALPYYKVSQLYPNAERTIKDIRLYSPPARSLIIAPEQSLVWGDLHANARATLSAVPEMTLLPGFALYSLAAVGLWISVWRPRRRALLLLGAVVSGLLALGTGFLGGRFTYVPLVDHLPGWNGLRTPGRLVLWTTIFLALLAAGAVTEFVRRAEQFAAPRIPSWPGPWLRLATLVPLLLVTAEGLNRTPHPIVPPQPPIMRTVDGPLVVLPTQQVTDENVMLWSTTRFQQIANGGSGFIPARQAQLRRIAETFPSLTSVAYLRSLGIRTVVLLRDRVAGTPWERAGDVPVDGLGIQREDLPDTVVFHL
jgi:hypothetical protein